jgi:SAM-dependent methyltransferase
MKTIDLDRLGVQSGERVLDLGAGGGRHAFAALDAGARVVAVDLDEASLKEAGGILAALVERDGGQAATAVGDAVRLPFADAAFDRVMCAETMEHIHDDRGAMAEIGRVLRPGGTLAVTVPRFGPELVCWALSDEYHNTPGGHVRIYRQSVLAGRLRDAGFEFAGVGFAHGLHSPYWWLRCLIGLDKENPVTRAYHRLLVWDMAQPRPWPTRLAEAAMNPSIAKSIVVYARKPAATT